jgi:hypothetical protein
MSKYLAIVVVLCAIELSQALKADPKLVVTELNHVKDGDRVTQFECQFEKEADAEAISSVVVTKKKITGTDTVDIFSRVGTNDPTKTKVDGEVADTAIEIPDKTKNVFTIKKAEHVEGEYTCTVVTDKTPATRRGTYTVKKDRETIDFQIHEKDDKENKHEFKKDNQIDATFEYVLATDSVYSKVEFLKVDKVFFRISKDGDKDKPESLDDAKDIGVKKEMVEGKRDGTNNKILVTIKNTYKETAGNFKAVLYYKEKAGAEDSHIESGNIELKYTGGAATTMVSFASISTLLLAFAFVRSNF